MCIYVSFGIGRFLWRLVLNSDVISLRQTTNTWHGDRWVHRSRNRTFRLADSVWPIRSGRFGLSRFGHGTFRSWSFRSQDISVRLWTLAGILHVNFLMQTNQRKVLHKKITDMIQDPTVDQHQHDFHVNFLMQTYLNQRNVLFEKQQTWSKIQQLSINIWFSC